MHIRRAVPKDFPAIAALDRDVWSDRPFIPDGEHVWRIWIEHALVFCAESNERISGAIVAFPCMNGSYCLHKVFVRASSRDRGIGSKLFGELLDEIDRRNGSTFLTVDPDNASAITLYEKWGFTERTFVSGYYRADEDRFVLTRKATDTRGRDG